VNSEEYIAAEEQKVIDNLWSARNAVTIDDLDFLAELKVEYGDCCGLESNCPLEIRVERACMECEPKIFPGDWAFLQSCGIAVEPARGKVYIKIEMQGAVVRKARELHARRKRKSLMGDEKRSHGVGEIDLGEIV
jgi:hypothetical protein